MGPMFSVCRSILWPSSLVAGSFQSVSASPHVECRRVPILEFEIFGWRNFTIIFTVFRHFSGVLPSIQHPT
jgi:hypothetical protein